MTVEIAAGSIGAVLLAVIGYFLKTRDKRLIDVERKAEGTEKDVAVISGNQDTISKRLSAGADTFKEITQTQKALQQAQTDIILNFVRVPVFEKEQEKTEEKFSRVDAAIEGIREDIGDMRLSMKGIEKTFEGGIDNMRRLLAKVVKIGDPENE